MKLKTVLLITGCFTISVLGVVFFYLFSDKINDKKNGFIRLFPPHMVEYQKKLDIKYNSYYITGATSENVYLGNYVYPIQLLKINYSSMDSMYLNLAMHVNGKIAWRALTIKIDSPILFIYDYITPVLLQGDLTTLQVYPLKIKDKELNRCLPVTSTTFINTVYDKNHEQNILEKLVIGDQSVYSVPPTYRLERQGDGTFSTDGILNYSMSKGLLIYVYYYHNRFDCLDTNLALIYKSSTIDTISKAKIKLATIKSEGLITEAAPPLVVNKLTCVNEDELFINSSLLANNEDRRLFDHASVIDVYNLNGGNYKYSFYLPDFEKHKISGFQVVNKTLIAIYDHYILTYHINL